MPNRWVEHIRKFAKDNNMTYSSALSDPRIRDGYVPAPKKGKKAMETHTHPDGTVMTGKTHTKSSKVILEGGMDGDRAKSPDYSRVPKLRPAFDEYFRGQSLPPFPLMRPEIEEYYRRQYQYPRPVGMLKRGDELTFPANVLDTEQEKKKKKGGMMGGRTRPPPEPAPFDGVETEVGRRRTRRPRRQPDMRNLLPPELVVPALPFPDFIPDTPRVFLRRVEDRIGGAKRPRPRAAGAGDEEDEEEEESGYSTPPASVPVQFATAPPPPPVARNLLSEFDDEADADPEFVSPPSSPASSVPTTPETQPIQVGYFDTPPDLATPLQSRQVGDPDNEYLIQGSYPPQYETFDSDSDMDGGARGSRVPTSEIQRLRLINQLQQERQREFDRGNYNVVVPPLSRINADLDFLGEKNEPQPPNPIPPTRQALSDMEGGVRRPMEDNFFFPARDRDRRYDMVDYNRVIPHHMGFRMTSVF